MAPQTDREDSVQEDERVFLCLLSYFLFVPSQVITINCAMRAVQTRVYREASTNPSSAFSPGFSDAIAYHISTVIFLTARIKKWILPHIHSSALLPHLQRKKMVCHQKKVTRHM